MTPERGRLKEMLERYGTLYEIADDGGKFARTISPAQIPTSAAGCEWFLDLSDGWRSSYLGVRMEEAGAGRYAVLFKEGSRSTRLRAAVMLLLMAVPYLAPILTGMGWLVVPAVALTLGSALLWIRPGGKAKAIVPGLIASLSHPADGGADAGSLHA